jgi:hypothetical protein
MPYDVRTTNALSRPIVDTRTVHGFHSTTLQLLQQKGNFKAGLSWGTTPAKIASRYV